jgi:hypothetical protein
LEAGVTATTDPRLVTAAEAARLLGVTRQRVLELADSAVDFPASQPAATGGWAWPRVALQAWAAANPDPGPVFIGPEPPPLFDRAPQLEQLRDLAADQAFALNHDSIGLDHLLLAMLQPRCPGAAGAVLQSFGVHADRLRRALIDSRGDPYGAKPTSVRTSEASQRTLERALVEAVVLADAEVTSEHVLLALTRRWERGCFATGWLNDRGISADAVRQRVVEITERVVLPEVPTALPEPPLSDRPSVAAELELAPNPLGHDPRRRLPWRSMAFDVPEDRPLRAGSLRRQYYLDRDGYPVLTTDGQPVHVVVDDDGVPVLDEHGHRMLGPVEIPPGGEVTALDPA